MFEALTFLICSTFSYFLHVIVQSSRRRVQLKSNLSCLGAQSQSAGLSIAVSRRILESKEAPQTRKMHRHSGELIMA